MAGLSLGAAFTVEEPADEKPGGMDHRWLLIIPLSLVILLIASSRLHRRLSWQITAGTLGIALLTIADASSFWSANNPSGFTVRSFATEGGDKHRRAVEDIQMGATKAVAESAIIGIGGSILTGSFLPWVAQASYLVVDWAWYEWCLRNPHTGRTGIASQAG